MDKSKQPLRKFKNPFVKSEESLRNSRLRKMCKYLPLRKYLFLRREFPRKYSRYPEYCIRIRKRFFLKSRKKIHHEKMRIIGRFFRSRRFFIRSRDQIHYKNIGVIGRFIGYQGKIIPRRVTKLTLRQQRLMTSAVKKARILCFLPFLENERHFRRVRRRQILNRRRKIRSRKTRRKTESRTIHPKNELDKTHPKNELGEIRPKIEPRTTLRNP